jgi:shikimate 5-dehydrogenase
LYNRLIQLVKKQPDIYGENIRDFLYLNFPAKDFDDFWTPWKTMIDGLSITIPHKINIVKKLNFSSSSVEKSGVCNTAIRRKNSWWGFNTDMLAIYDLLKESDGAQFNSALVYGTGATARSAVTALMELSVDQIILCGRNDTVGSQVAEEFSINFIPEQKLAKVQPQIIIQTTPMGMTPNSNDIPPLSHLLPVAELVFDVVHNPPLTRFLKEARAANCQIISGEQMYLRQATYQFGLFSGVELPKSVIVNMWNNEVAMI